MKNYQDINSETIDRWVSEGWEWGKAIPHDIYIKAEKGEWDVLLTPQKTVPHEWFGDLKGKKVLGLASGGGQQMPIFTALGAECTVLDYSQAQLRSEREVVDREGYDIRIVHGDMTKPLPFEDEEFDLIFHPVSNCYVEKVEPIFKECYRVLKKGGVLLGGYDHIINYVLDDTEEHFAFKLPFNPLKNPDQMEFMQKGDYGVQFSHTLEEQLGGQIAAGFIIDGFYEDGMSEGRMKEFGIPTFYAVRARKL